MLRDCIGIFVCLTFVAPLALSGERTSRSAVSAPPAVTRSIAKSNRDLRESPPYIKAFQLEQALVEKDLRAIEEKIRLIEVRKSMARGGVDTGGGTIVKTADGFGLLDLNLHDKSDSRGRAADVGNIRETRALRLLGVESFRNGARPLVGKVRSHIERWRRRSPLVSHQLLLALDNLPLYYHKGSMSDRPLEYFLPSDSQLRRSDLKLAALFDERLGAHFGLDELRLLSERHQIALVIHECLRFINYTGALYLTNETIQKLTAELIGDPEESESVDREDYLSGEIALMALKHAQFELKVRALTDQVCEQLAVPTSAYCTISTNPGGSEKLTDLLWKGFSELYLNEHVELSESARRDFLGQTYTCILTGENMQLQGALDEGAYSKKYLELRTRFMPLDLLIDKVNLSSR